MMKNIAESDGMEMHLAGADAGNILNGTAQSVVFTIIEEALSNARKHASAERIDVRLWQEDDLFVVQIADDGCGFDAQSIGNESVLRGSLGMINMRERAERIDGSLKVDSEPDAGTTVTLIVPLTTGNREDNAGQPEPAVL
jgi:signal transduction histidine kinase